MITDRSDTPATRLGVPPGLLLRYRVMAYLTAVLLIVLVFAGIPLQVAAGRPEVVNIVGTLHGFLYIVYLVVAFALTRRLGIPKWQMMLVLLAGTVPFAAFVAERKMTRRYLALVPSAGKSPRGGRPLGSFAVAFRRRWLSRRALLLHFAVVVLAPACLLAGWWQATRALAGNALSWVYCVEWPIFACLAIAGWWHLVHEDPEALRARKASRTGDGPLAVFGPDDSELEPSETFVGRSTAFRAARLAAGIGAEGVLGIMCILSTPVDRPGGFWPQKGVPIYLAHSIFGFLLVVGAAALLVHVRASSRVSKAIAWMGAAGVALAGLGGLLTASQQLVRFLGMALMLVGSLWAIASYLMPIVLRRRQQSPGQPAEVLQP